jgi:hypothetical protein
MKFISPYNLFKINESSQEEAWELVGQSHPVISFTVNSLGYSFDEESVIRLSAIINGLPEYLANYYHIKDFDNLENKDSDIGLLQKMKEISTLPNARNLYRKLMLQRDLMDVDNEGRPRKRSYNVVENFDRILSSQYEPPVIFYDGEKYYVVGGRTRLFASVAANVPIRVKVLTKEDLVY